MVIPISEHLRRLAQANGSGILRAPIHASTEDAR